MEFPRFDAHSLTFEGECPDAENEEPDPAEFREQFVALADTGRGVDDLVGEFGPCAATIHGWIKQADRDGGRRIDGLTSQERDELRRLL